MLRVTVGIEAEIDSYDPHTRAQALEGFAFSWPLPSHCRARHEPSERGYRDCWRPNSVSVSCLRGLECVPTLRIQPIGRFDRPIGMLWLSNSPIFERPTGTGAMDNHSVTGGVPAS
jgi:hypothetical protein